MGHLGRSGSWDLEIWGPRDLRPSRSGGLQIWRPSGSGPWGPVPGSPFEPSGFTSGGPVCLLLLLRSAPQDALHRAAVRLVSASEVLGMAQTPRMGSQTLPKWVISGSKMGHFRPLRGSDLRQIGIKRVQDPVDLGSKTLDPGIQTPKDTVKRSKGDSIDGQIMLFPITRAREGIYKDPGYPGSWDRPRTPFGVLRESHLARFNGRSRGFGLQLGSRMVPEWVQNRSFQGSRDPRSRGSEGSEVSIQGRANELDPKMGPSDRQFDIWRPISRASS